MSIISDVGIPGVVRRRVVPAVGIETGTDLLGQKADILLLAIEDSALDGDGIFENGGDADRLAGDGMEAAGGQLIQVPAAFAAADGDGVFVRIPQGDIDGKFRVLIQQLPGIAADPDVGGKNRQIPVDAHGAPADDHAVRFAVGGGGEQDALGEGLGGIGGDFGEGELSTVHIVSSLCSFFSV